MGKAAGGAIALRMPSYALASRLLDFTQLHRLPDGPVTTDPDTGEASVDVPLAWHYENLPYMAAVIGAAWADPVREFSTPPLPSTSLPSMEELYAYGAAIADELQTEGWPVFAIGHLGSAALAEIARRLSIVNEAAALADFMPAQAAPSIGTS